MCGEPRRRRLLNVLMDGDQDVNVQLGLLHDWVSYVRQWLTLISASGAFEFTFPQKTQFVDIQGIPLFLHST